MLFPFPHLCGDAMALPLTNAIGVIRARNKGIIMQTSSSAHTPGRIQASVPSLNLASRLHYASTRSFAGEQLSAKLYSVGFHAAITVLLSIFGLGSAMGQSMDQDLLLGANTQATRNRVVSEIRQARADGTVKRWSPVLLELPSRTPRQGIRIVRLSTHPSEGGTATFVSGESSVSSPESARVPPAAAQ